MTAADAAVQEGRARAWFSLLPEPGPGRILFWATLINAAGTGLYLTSSALFFVRCLGVSANRVGVGLTTAGLIGLLAGVPVGHLADRRGPREVYLVTLSAQAVAMAALVAVRSFAEFVLVSAATALASSASSAARGPLIRAAGGRHPARLRSRLRSGSNLGVAVGGPLAAVAIGLNTRTAYMVLILLNALSFAVCAVMASRLPHVSGTAGTAGTRERAPGRLRAMTDRPFLCFVALYTLMMQQYPVLTLVLPLWISGHTQVPHWLIGVVVPLNTGMVVLLQVPLSRRIGSPLSAARLMPRAGLALLAGLALMGALGPLPAWEGAAVLVTAVALYTLGEIWFAAVCYELSFGLAPAAAQGQYLGLYSMGNGLGRVVSQSLVTTLCLTLGVSGWLLLGGLMVAAGCAMVPTAKWALRAGAVATTG